MILSAALVLLGARSSLSFTATKIGTFHIVYWEPYINQDGAVALNDGDGLNTDMRAFYWKDGQLTQITVPDSMMTLAKGVTVRGIAEDGTVLACSNEPGFETGFLWTKDGGIIKHLPADFRPEAMNPSTKDMVGTGVEDGHWVQGRMHSDVFSPIFEVDQPDGMTAMNGSGVAVGNPATGDGVNQHPIRLGTDGTQEAFASAFREPGHQEMIGAVRAINSAGWAVGGIGYVGTTPREAVTEAGAIWSPSNQLTRVPGMVTFHGINDAGYVVGTQKTVRGKKAVIYTSVDGVQDLNSLIPGAGFDLAEAKAINNHNEIVCVDSSGYNVYLLKPSS